MEIDKLCWHKLRESWIGDIGIRDTDFRAKNITQNKEDHFIKINNIPEHFYLTVNIQNRWSFNSVW